jgi:hypothetical protein
MSRPHPIDPGPRSRTRRLTIAAASLGLLAAMSLTPTLAAPPDGPPGQDRCREVGSNCAGGSESPSPSESPSESPSPSTAPSESPSPSTAPSESPASEVREDVRAATPLPGGPIADLRAGAADQETLLPDTSMAAAGSGTPLAIAGLLLLSGALFSASRRSGAAR